MPKGIVENLVAELTRLPGIGRKTAQRLAFFIMKMPREEALSMANAIIDAKDKARFCSKCFNIAEADLCPVCSDKGRDGRKLCVVEEPSNIIIVERSGVFRGLYHVLLGSLSPLDNVTPEDLRIAELVERVRREGIEEVIIATNPNTKGEFTARYIKDLLAPLGVEVTRIAYGLPMGGDIEFADEVTLKKALEGRTRI